ncbi:hypothetical protein E0Z10_g7033 [Xylaria hypoxylon]|uniref:HMG box domain-containing protein n=1 Tax=Xylaria hypoxylon TaxID=37992 RepID=A0A4Z0YEU3_9PEZI|nr:hypothetical protein E0Z10_g7033 [Xylaria hypoxylon]
MTDTASISSDHYASPSSSSSYTPSLQHSSVGGRVSSLPQYRPPVLKIDTTLPRRPQSQPIMAASGHISVTAAKPLLLPTPASSSYTHHDEYDGVKNKKRAKSIDVEEANQSNIARLSLYTPTTARSDGPRELICLCAKAPKIPRPRNAFILYRQAWQGYFATQNPGLANPEISKLIGEKWREQPESVKNEWKQLAEDEKIRHQRQYPGYRYQPRRGGKNGSGRPTSSSGDASGRCPKCGGRYIATPRTPTTPFNVASPPPPKRPMNMQQYTNADHPRHGSVSGGVMPGDAHVRRYTQPQLRDIEEDYAAMSPMAGPLSGIPPDAKRRRYNGPPVYVPGSPHMGYAPVDPRYQQHPSIGGPPMSATGYGPGHLPRPPMQHRQGIYPVHPANHHMQPPPPPRPSMSYQPVSTPNRPNSGFDESLRLPPLQTPMNDSPIMSAEPSTRQVMLPAQPQQGPGTGLGITNPGGGPIRQPQQQQPQPPPPASPMLQKWPFLLKLDVLRSITPPLRPPGPGGSHFETRGPIIAVEGAPTLILKEVAAVIERALSVSAEFAVKVWSEDTSTAIAHSSPEPHASGSSEVSGNNNNNDSNYNNIIGNNKGGSENSGSSTNAAGATSQKKSSSLISPIANYVARMLKWHKTSEDLIRYITSHPPPQQAGADSGSDASAAASTGASNLNNNNTTSSARLPVAILSDGYSLTFSDRYANALHVNDAYRADDHWQWVATLWRGVVGADLTVYVKRAADEAPGGSSNSVEMAAPGVMVLRVPDGGRVDEKLERRLGFEIAEWVRGGSFMAGFGKT